MLELELSEALTDAKDNFNDSYLVMVLYHGNCYDTVTTKCY